MIINKLYETIRMVARNFLPRHMQPGCLAARSGSGMPIDEHALPKGTSEG